MSFPGLFTNAFRIEAAEEFTLYQYVFYFEPHQDSRNIRFAKARERMYCDKRTDRCTEMD